MIRRAKQRLSRLWSSISFRLTFNYGLLATLTTLLLVAFIYFQFMSALHTQRSRQIDQSGQRLVVVFEEGGRDDLIRAIELTLSDRIDSEREFYLLLDEQGRRITGNLDALPKSHPVSHDIFEATIVQGGKKALGHLKTIELPDGSLLVVGHDTREIDAVSSLTARSILAVLLFALILVFIGTYIFRRELEYRVSTIRRTTEKIGAGELSQRIPLSGIDDEFSYLNRDINIMLDRIEALMKGVRFVSDTIAHNLRTPLMRIVGRLQTAQQPGRSRDEVLQATQHAIDEIENLNVLFGKLLQIAELEAGVQRQVFRPCRVDSIAQDVVEMFEAYAEANGLELTFSSTLTANVNADPDLIASALANVLDNAMKYARRSVRVRVYKGSDGDCCISIADDGPGVPQHELARLGRHFHRLNPANEGHGLGLTSVTAIVGLHDGRLTFSDASPGLVAIISLPLAS